MTLTEHIITHILTSSDSEQHSHSLTPSHTAPCQPTLESSPQTYGFPSQSILPSPYGPPEDCPLKLPGHGQRTAAYW